MKKNAEYIGSDDSGEDVEWVRVASGNVMNNSCSCSICKNHKSMTDEWIKGSIQKANERNIF